MSEVLTDERIAAVLRPFVRSTAPVLTTLRESDPLRLRPRFHAGADRAPRRFDPLLRRLDRMRLPGSARWDAMTARQRSDWWTRRVGRVIAVVAGLPSFGGAIASRLPVRDALGMAGQGLVLGAIAGEHGVHDQAEQVRLLASVLLGRDLPVEVAAGRTADDDARTRELSGELDDARSEGRPGVRVFARTVWRMARALWEVGSALENRPRGRFYHELLGLVPVIGFIGGYLGERSALRRVSRRGRRWIRRRQGQRPGG
jgi:hypothetical protein